MLYNLYLLLGMILLIIYLKKPRNLFLERLVMGCTCQTNDNMVQEIKISYYFQRDLYYTKTVSLTNLARLNYYNPTHGKTPSPYEERPDFG